MAQRGIGVRGLARAVYCNPGHISNLRNGKARPSVNLAAALDRNLEAQGVLEEAAVRARRAPAHAPSGLTGKVGASSAVLNKSLEPWEVAEALTRSSLSATTVDILEESVVGLAARYPFTSPDNLVVDVQAILSVIGTALVHSQPLSVRERCVRLACIACGVAGQLADDTARPDRSAAWFSVASIAADEICDPDLAAWVLAVRSIGCHFRGEYDLAAELLSRARIAGSSCTFRRQAWLVALSARANAAVACRRGGLGERGSSVAPAVDNARALLQAAGPPSGTDFFDGPRLAGMAGTAMLMAGDIPAAKAFIEEALAGRTASDVKGRALLTLDLAECMVAEHEPEQAVELAASAINMQGSGIVVPVINRAALIHRALRPWSRCYAELGDKLAELHGRVTEG